MKYPWTIIWIVLALIIGCNSREQSLERFWVGYMVSHTKGDRFEIIGHLGLDPLEKDPNFDSIYTDTTNYVVFFDFKYDSLTITTFEESGWQSYWNTNYNYRLDGDSLRISAKEKIEVSTANVELLDNHSLVISYPNDPSTGLEKEIKLIFQPVDIFHQKENQEVLLDFLKSNSVYVKPFQADLKFIEPTNHRYGRIISKPQMDFGDDNEWHVLTLKRELFLVLGQYIIQIKDIKKDMISGIIYGPENQEIQITKPPKEQ